MRLYKIEFIINQKQKKKHEINKRFFVLNIILCVPRDDNLDNHSGYC